MYINSAKQFAVPVLVITAIPLLAQHIVTTGGDYPSTLCLYDQDVWWLLAGIWSFLLLFGHGIIGRIGIFLTIFIIICGVCLSGMQVGIEQKWWSSPVPIPCNIQNQAEPVVIQDGSNSGSGGDQNAPSPPTSISASCNPPTYLMPDVPISLAVIDCLYLLFLIFIIFAAGPIEAKAARRKIGHNA